MAMLSIVQEKKTLQQLGRLTSQRISSVLENLEFQVHCEGESTMNAETWTLAV